MQISHLAHAAHGVWCTRCKHRFQIPSRVLCDPHRLVEAKESIAARHCCRTIPRGPIESVRSLHPVLISSGYDSYWRKAITAAMS
jgi:hypothetical protein